jgi:hypothetical protein
MTKLQFSVIALILTTIFAGAAAAQKTASKRPPARQTTAKTTAPKTSTLPPLEVRAARVKVANQYSNVDQFVARLGPIAQSIEALDNESRTRKVSQSSLDLNKATKEKLLAAIKNMRIGIDALETEFETKPALKIYLSRIQGISELAAQSENLAFTGKFVASRDPWRTILQKLNDTLTAMPNAEL